MEMKEKGVIDAKRDIGKDQKVEENGTLSSLI